MAECLSRGDAEQGLRLCMRAAQRLGGLRRRGRGHRLVRQVPGPDRRAPPVRPGPAPRAGPVRARALVHRAELAFEQQDFRRGGPVRPGRRWTCSDSASDRRRGQRALRILALVSLRAAAARTRPWPAWTRPSRRPARPAVTGVTGRKGWRSAARAGILARLGQLDEAEQAFESRPVHAARQQRLGHRPDPVRVRHAGPRSAATTPPRWPTSATRWACTGRSTPGPRSPAAWPASAGWRWPSSTSSWPPPA